MSTTEELQEKIATLESSKSVLQGKIAELDEENANLLNQVEELEAELSIGSLADSGHDDPGVEHETKAERQARLRQRSDDD